MATLPIPIDDYAAGTHTTGILTLDKPVRASFDNSYYTTADSDWFKVQLIAGETYVFQLTSTALSSFKQVELALRDAAGELLTTRAGASANGPAFEFTATTSGTYFVDARSTAPYSGGSIIYDVSMSRKPEGDDFAAASTTVGTLALGVQKDAVHSNPGDADWFAFSFEAGKTYALAPASTNGNPIDLSVVSSDGTVLAAPGSAFTPAQSGTYYVNATGYSTGNYGFTLTEATDDVASGIATQGTIATGGQVDAKLDYIGDSDWYKVRLEANTFYTFELSTTAAGEGIQFLLMKPDGSASEVTRTTDAEGKSVAMLRVDAAGDYFANVAYGGFHSGDVVKPYTLKLSGTAVADDHGDKAATASPAAIGVTVGGELTGKLDTDMLKYTLSKGVTYFFKHSTSEAMSVSASLRDANGVYLAANYNDEGFAFTPQADGDVYLVLEPRIDPLGDGAARLPYTVASSLAADDFSANTDTTGKVAVGSSIKGSLIAALVLGVCDVAGKYSLPDTGDFIIYGIMVSLLLWRPLGLFGRR